MAHNNTLFHSMLSFIPRHQFDALENEHGTGRKSRHFSRWNQFVHLMFMQLTGRSSLRDGIQSMNSRLKNLYHLGAKPVARSTFADANGMRPASFYEALFEKIYQRCRMISPKHKFKFKNELYSLDATVIDLSLGAFPWASFRRTKSAIKVHTLMNHSGYLPAFVSITDGKKHESKVASTIKLPKGSIVAEDRAYTDYAWFAQLQLNGVFFVTRQKTNAVYKVIERRSVNKKQGLCSDQTILLTGTKSHLCPHPLRRVGYRDPETKKHYVFLTNNFKLSAKTIADIYKERWQIGVSSKGHIIQSVKVRPGTKGSIPVAWEAPWRESKMVKPSDRLFRKEMMQGFRPQRTVNADVASLHATSVAETVDNVRRQQGSFETSPIRRFSPTGYQRWHVAKDYVSTGEALGVRRRNLVEEAVLITLNGKWERRHQGGGLGCSTVDRCAAKRTSRKGPRPVVVPFVDREAGAR